MSEILKFNIHGGVLECDLADQTKNLISGDVSALNDAMVSMREEAFDNEELSLICFGRNKSLGLAVNGVEGSQIYEARGAAREGLRCKYNEILADLK